MSIALHQEKKYDEKQKLIRPDFARMRCIQMGLNREQHTWVATCWRKRLEMVCAL